MPAWPRGGDELRFLRDWRQAGQPGHGCTRLGSVPRAGGAAQLQQPARTGQRTVPDGQATRLGDPGIATSRSGALTPAFTRTASVTVVLSRAQPSRLSRLISGRDAVVRYQVPR